MFSNLNKSLAIENQKRDSVSMNIGEKIKALRVANGLTQEELANRCELTKALFHRLKEI